MDNVFDFDLDKVNCTEQIATILGLISYTTMVLKDMDIPNDEILPILRAFFGADIELTDEHEKIIPDVLKVIKAYSSLQDKSIITTIKEILAKKDKN